MTAIGPTPLHVHVTQIALKPSADQHVDIYSQDPTQLYGLTPPAASETGKLIAMSADGWSHADQELFRQHFGTRFDVGTYLPFDLDQVAAGNALGRDPHLASLRGPIVVLRKEDPAFPQLTQKQLTQVRFPPGTKFRNDLHLIHAAVRHINQQVLNTPAPARTAPGPDADTFA